MATLSTLPLGTVIEDEYEVRRILGRGGAAVVYEALRLEDEATVAIKVLAPDEGDPQQTRKRFFNELVLATRVRHPNMVRVHDFGLLTGTGAPYIVMDRLYGRTLWQDLRERGPMDPEHVVPLFLGALDALAAAHAKGVVHKDLKPSNLFLSQTGPLGESLVILDFGIASRMGGPGAQGIEFSGTPPYSAPEYINYREISPRVDIYQLGLVLAEVLSGRPVVDSDDADECFRIHQEGRLELPYEVMPGPISAIVTKAVAFEPEDRYPNARAMHDALATVMVSRGPVPDDDVDTSVRSPTDIPIAEGRTTDVPIDAESYEAMTTLPPTVGSGHGGLGRPRVDTLEPSRCPAGPRPRSRSTRSCPTRPRHPTTSPRHPMPPGWGAPWPGSRPRSRCSAWWWHSCSACW